MRVPATVAQPAYDRPNGRLFKRAGARHNSGNTGRSDE
ncbi:hypothetical protein C7S15_0832 [Burkholderia cepacia]|nr:hypothetical protein [Burkholderia cepacia]